MNWDRSPGCHLYRKIDREKTLRDITDQNPDGYPRSETAKRVGRPKVAAPMFSKIDTAKCFPRQKTERNRPCEIADKSDGRYVYELTCPIL